MGQSPDGANYTDNPKDHILVQGNADMKDHRVCPRVWTTQVTKTAEPGDIILSVRAPVGEVGKTDYDVVLGRGVSGIRGNDFIYHSLIRMNEIGYWSSLSTGSTFDSINSNDISNAVIAVPSQSEQEKIGCFLTRIDDLLSLHQRSWTTDPCSNKPGQRSHDQIDVFVLELLDDVEVGSLGCVHG